LLIRMPAVDERTNAVKKDFSQKNPSWQNPNAENNLRSGSCHDRVYRY
jgi:hypothetical protein